MVSFVYSTTYIIFYSKQVKILRNEKIKVLVITTTKFEIDGITNVILNYFRAMDKSDMQIDFVIPNELRDDLRTELCASGSHIYILKRRKNFLAYIIKLKQRIRNNKYHIVHAHGNSCTLVLEMYAAKKGGAKVRISHSHNTTCKHIILHKVLRRFFDKSYTHAFACGQKAGKWLYNKKPFEVIRNGININKYKYDEKIRIEYRNKYDFNGKKVIGHVGRFSYQKNHEFIIKIFSELYKLDNNYRLLLIGDGELRTHIEKQIKDLALSDVVTFTGNTLDVPQLMQAMDIFIMPSRFEGLPLTLIEAQAACLPCFVSDSISEEVAITELVKFISLKESPKKWAEKINHMNFINRNEMKDIICNKIVDAGYSIVDNARKLKKLYELYIEQVNK